MASERSWGTWTPNQQMSCSIIGFNITVWTVMCSDLNQGMPLNKYIITAPFQCCTYLPASLLDVRSYALTYTPHSAEGWQARNTCHINTATADPPVICLSWKTACSQCQTGRGHADWRYRSRNLVEGFVLQSLGVREGRGRTEVQCKSEEISMENEAWALWRCFTAVWEGSESDSTYFSPAKWRQACLWFQTPADKCGTKL